jgi:restriction endonuclease S subunit
MSFELSPEVNRKKVFLVKYKELEDRLDPYYYKDEFKLLIEAIKNTGHAKTLKSLNAYIKKGVFDMSPDNYTEQGIPFLRVADITFDGMDFSSTVFIDEKIHREQLNTEFLPGDIVIAKIGHTIGKVSVLPNRFPKYNISQNVVGIKIPTPLKGIVSSEYLKLFLTLNNGKKQVIRQSSHGAQPKITLDALRKILIPILDVNKQKVVVAHYKNGLQQKKQKEAEAQQLLDSIDDYLLTELGIKRPEAVANTLKNRIFIRQSSEVSGGRFDPFYYQNEFEELEIKLKNSIYPLEKLRNLPLFLESGSRPNGGVANIEKGILSFGGEHVNRTCEIEVRKKKYIPIEFHQNHLLTETKLNDVLLVKDGATTGKIGIITDHNHVNQNINEHVFLIRFDSKVVPRYFVSLLNMKFYQFLLKRIITGATVTGLTKDVIRGLKIPLPPIEKQTEIANHIQTLRNQAKQLQQQAQAELKQAKQQVERMILGEH